MTLNSKQKGTLAAAFLLLLTDIGLWIGTGSHVYTKQQIQQQVYDEFLGTTYVVWEDVFMIGLDIAVPVAVFVIATSALLLWFFRTKIN